jgi:ribosomal-protein-alanine N-acetyltransferase
MAPPPVAGEGLAVAEAGQAHAAAIAALSAECFDDGGWSGESVRTLLRTPGTFALIAEAAGRPAGFILCRAAADEAEVLTIGVRPRWRGRGIGGGLLDAALARLGAAGIGRLFLEVGVDNRAALALYASRGFRQAGRRPAYYTRPGTPARDALVLRRDLDDPADGGV